MARLNEGLLRESATVSGSCSSGAAMRLCPVMWTTPSCFHRIPGGRWVRSRSSEQHDRSSQGRGPNSPIVALIHLGPLGCPAVHFGAQRLTVDIAVQVASLRGRRTLTFKNHIQVAHSCVAGTPLMNGHGHPFS